MIFWVLLFILVVAISFLLALRSMRSFSEVPQASEKDYRLFLIRKTVNVTVPFLNQLSQQILKEGLPVSFERLFKGNESTLLLYAPAKIIQNYLKFLDLLEIEDYTSLREGDFLGFEMGTKDATLPKNFHNFFQDFPQLEDSENLWWQLVLRAKKMGMFEVLPRVIITSALAEKRAGVEQKLHHLAGGFLTKVPKPYSKSQMLKFYKQREFGKGVHNPTLASEEILKLILLK